MSFELRDGLVYSSQASTQYSVYKLKTSEGHIVMELLYFVVMLLVVVQFVVSVDCTEAASTVSHTCYHQPSPAAGHSYSVCDLRSGSSNLVCTFVDTSFA